MPETTLTIVLGGDVPLDLFVESMQRLRLLIDALTEEVGGEAGISWVVDELAAGNAVATIRGEAERAEDVERVVRAYVAVGRALERHEVIPYSPRVVDAARNLTSVLNGKITSIRFESERDEATVTTNAADEPRAYRAAFGAVEGRIETLRSRRRLSFTLYDSLNDQAVYCLLRPEQAELVRDAWGRRVIVEGWIKREPTTGRPVEINPVERIDIQPEVVPGSYRRARAVAPARPGAPPTETVIRRLRDA
ncbi:MAG TPA: hypothetical protein VH482_02340 [Thermomicrobiales bacterium]